MAVKYSYRYIKVAMLDSETNALGSILGRASGIEVLSKLQ